MHRNARLLLLMLALLLATAFSAQAADCTYYGNSHAEDFDVDRGGAACIGYGPGCNQCITWYASGGFRVCVWSSFWEDYCCYYYGSPDNQIG